MIQVRNLHKEYAGKVVLEDLSLDLPAGQICFILGRSGVGKSVLLRHIVGLEHADSGTIEIDGHRVGEDEESLVEIRRQCGMVFQFPALLDYLTVRENLAFGLWAGRLVTQEADADREILRGLKWVGLDKEILDRKPENLSFGTQKRVSLLRTLLVGPRYLLFDEPTTSLDPLATHAINGLILDLSFRMGCTSLIVSHDIRSALQIGQRIILLNQGRIVFDGTPKAFRSSDNELAQGFLRSTCLT